MLVAIARIFAKDRETTIKEIELWIKHLGPVWMTNAAWMKKALTNWYREMQQLGLAPEREEFYGRVHPPGFANSVQSAFSSRNTLVQHERG